MKSGLILLLVASFLHSAASASVDLNRDLGFYSVNVAPLEIQSGAPAVLKLKVVFAQEEKSFMQVDASDGKSSKVIESIQAIKADLNLDELDKLVMIEEVRECETYKSVKDQKECTLFMTNISGTGFVTGDGLHLWTNGHVIAPYLNTLEKFAKIPVSKQLKEKSRVIVFGFDQNNKLVLNPYKNSVKIETIPKLSKLASLENSFYAEDSDYIGLKLAKPLAGRLQFSKGNVTPGDSIYVLGYPLCTGCDVSQLFDVDQTDFATRAPLPDSLGNRLTLTKGHILSFADIKEFFEVPKSFELLCQFQKIIFSSNDDAEGNSGSPILNSRGEVVGILTGGKSKLKDGKVNHISRGVLIPLL